MRSITSIIVFAYLLVAANAISKEFVERFVKKVNDFGAVCIPETNAKQDDITTLLGHQIPDSHEAKCLLFCLHKKFEIQNDDGTLNHQGAIKAMEAIKADDPEAFEKIQKIAIGCAPKIEIDADPCITAQNIYQCFIDGGKAAGFSSDMFEI